MVAGRRRAWCDVTSTLSQRIGFMQGRLSPQIDGRIQAFPWPFWQEEFAAAAAIGLEVMEWTLDAERLDENPLMTEAGRRVIREHIGRHSVGIPSVTGDCFMQQPFWKARHAADVDERVAMLHRVVIACGAMSITKVVVPLVDAGSVSNPDEEACFRRHLLECTNLLRQHRVKIVIESDRPPEQQARLVDAFPADCVGVNFDMGNSASLGWSPADEIRSLGQRIANVHVKDRTVGGGTVPLGTGAVDFPTVFRSLADVGYTGPFILQTARVGDGQHSAALHRYASFIMQFLTE